MELQVDMPPAAKCRILCMRQPQAQRGLGEGFPAVDPQTQAPSRWDPCSDRYYGVGVQNRTGVLKSKVSYISFTSKVTD